MLRQITAGALAVVGIAALAGAEAPERPTFTKDVLPILQENCQSCHRPNTAGTSGMVAPMTLMTYQDVRPWAKAISKAVSTEYMPPWFADKDFHGVFRNERTLTQDEIDTIVNWASQGAPRGNPTDAPEPKDFPNVEWYLGEPDLVVSLPEPVWVGDDVEDWQPNIEIPLTEEQLPEDRWMRTLEAIPGSEVVHHIVVYTNDYDANADTDHAAARLGYSNIGGLAPGAEPSLLQDGYGIKVKKGTTLRVSMHYHKEPGPGTGTWDQSKLGFFFYDDEEVKDIKPVSIEPIGLLDFEIPPGHENWTVGMAREFDRPIRILKYLPHMHVRGTSAEYVAYFPDGTKQDLLRISDYDYNWQLYYEYPEPLLLPAGTRVEVKMTFDNSPENLSNPNPTDAIPFGPDTVLDEMALGWMHYSWADEKEASTD